MSFQWTLPVGEKNLHSDFRMIVQGKGHFDYLCFFDSRGSSLDANTESVSRLLEKHFLSQGKTFIIICRPLDNTVYFTLYNFIQANPFTYAKLITNLGFVDCTPKKNSIIDDILLQKNEYFSDIDCPTVEMEPYALIDGSTAMLHTMDPMPCAARIAGLIRNTFRRAYLIKTHEFDSSCTFPRKRPLSFYRQLPTTNLWVDSIANHADNCWVLEPAPLSGHWQDLSYDGVHFTDQEHRRLAQRIIDAIDPPAEENTAY